MKHGEGFAGLGQSKSPAPVYCRQSHRIIKPRESGKGSVRTSVRVISFHLHVNQRVDGGTAIEGHEKGLTWGETNQVEFETQFRPDNELKRFLRTTRWLVAVFGGCVKGTRGLHSAPIHIEPGFQLYENRRKIIIIHHSITCLIIAGI